MKINDEIYYKVNADFGQKEMSSFYFSYLDAAIDMVYMIKDDDHINADLYKVEGSTLSMINV